MSGLKFKTITTIFILVLVQEFVANSGHQCEDITDFRRIIGITSSKVLIAITLKADWGSVMEDCHNRNMISASINSQGENDLVTRFLNASSDIHSFWLPATDFITEGTFAWVHDKTPLSYANWAAGSPSISRSKNCVAIQKNGSWTEEPCGAPGVRHNGLCEVPLLEQLFRNEEFEQLALKSPTKNPTNLPRDNYKILKEAQLKTQSAKIVLIGQIGTKLYFKDETRTPRKIYAALDFCHVLGMRLLTPETEEELEFLQKYADEEDEWQIMTSGSDMMAPGCNRGNAMFRWFYSPEPVQAEVHPFHHHWYLCIFLTPANVYMSDCIGFLAPTFCELDTAVHA